MASRTPNKSGEMIAEDTRERILAAALHLLETGGKDAVTTRAVAEAAGVQPPILYRQFGDKEGMLEALAEHGYLRYLARKRQLPLQPDSIETLRNGWDQHIDFGLQHPMLYLLMYAEPRPGRTSQAAERSFAMLREHMARVAASGQLRVSEEKAVSLYHAAAVGVVLFFLNTSHKERDPTISTMAREAVLAGITGVQNATSLDSPASNAAITLRSTLDSDAPFSATELALLKEWLGRITKQAESGGSGNGNLHG